MSTEEQLQQNIRRSTGVHALKKIGAIVDEENRNDVADARICAGCCVTVGSHC